MGADGHLNFDTKIDEQGFNSGVSKLGSVAKGGLAVLGGAVAGVTAAMGAGVVAGVKYNAGIEQYQTSFEVMTGSADEAAKIMENLKKVGADTPFELKDLADTTQLLMNYGMTADDAQSKMMMLGDISQGSSEKMNRVATAYGQMSSAGKVQLEDIKQMIEAGFNPLQEISESTGESMSSLYDRISKGTLGVDEITASMTRATAEGGKYSGSMEKQSQTVTGMISTLKDNAQQLLGDVVKPITESIAGELLPGAISAIGQLTTAFKEGGVDGLIEAGSQIITNLIQGIANALPSIIDTAVQIMSSIITNLTAQMPQLMNSGMKIISSLLQGIFTMLPQLFDMCRELVLNFANSLSEQLPVLIPAAVQIITTLIQGLLDDLPRIIETGLKLILALVDGLVDAIPQLIDAIPKVIEGILSALIGALPQIIEAGVKILVALINGLIDAIPRLVAAIPKIIAGIVNAIINNLPLIISSGIKIIGALVSGLINAIPSIVGAIPRIVSSIVTSFRSVNWGDVGINIIKGIANGLAGAVGFVVDAAKNAAKKALNAAKSFLGIHSPSTVFRDQVGKFMAKGMGVGFEDNIPTAEMGKSIHKSVVDMQSAAGGMETGTTGSATSVYNNIVNGGAGETYRDEPDEERGDTVINITENTYLDSELIATKTTPKVIKKIGKQQTNRLKAVGANA